MARQNGWIRRPYACDSFNRRLQLIQLKYFFIVYQRPKQVDIAKKEAVREGVGQLLSLYIEREIREREREVKFL